MANKKLLQFPLRNPDLFSREINRQVLSTSEFNRVLYAAIGALPHVKDPKHREDLKRALCSTNPENVCGLRRFLGCMALGSNGCELSCGRGELGKRGS